MRDIVFLVVFIVTKIYICNAFRLDFFNHWNCIGITDKIDVSIPYKTNIGDLPLVSWKNKENRWITTVNICKHMGSKLDNGKILENGCLQCPYHGLEYMEKDKFGETIEHNGKLFWAYNPIRKQPFSVPFYTNPNYITSTLEIDMDASLTDSAYNTMDLRHPEFVHNIGFGNSIPPENIQHYYYGTNSNSIGLSFDYSASNIMKTINQNIDKTQNFHMFHYPTFSWSRVSFENKHLIIGVNLLPLERKKTRWYITICHNYHTTEIGKQFMKILAYTILQQDYTQMQNQYEDNDLKNALLFNHVFDNELAILELRNMFRNYKYPDIDSCLHLYFTKLLK